MNPEQNNPQQTVGPAPTPPNPPAPQVIGQVPPNGVGPAQPQLPTEPPQDSSKRPLITTIVVLAIILLALVATYFVLSSKNDSQTNDQSSSAQQEEEEEETPAKDSVSDNHRLADVSQLLAGVTAYSADNMGKLPAVSDVDNDFASKYLDDEFVDPVSKEAYTVVENDPKVGEMQYKAGSTCGEDGSLADGSSRQFAVRVLLSDGTFYCASN